MRVSEGRAPVARRMFVALALALLLSLLASGTALAISNSLYCPNKSGGCTLFGTEGDDTFWANSTNPGDDAFYGNGGVDHFLAYGGNDTLQGGAGDDNVEGDDGNDTMDGGSGNDLMFAGRGEDVLHGNDGDDDLGAGDDYFGDHGDDQLYGDSGNDTLGAASDVPAPGNHRYEGGTGDDKVYGGDGDEYLDGGTENDLLVGNDGFDTLVGGDGNDELNGVGGYDTLYGGNGDDLLWALNYGETITPAPLVGELVDCGPGHDTAYVDGAVPPARLVNCEVIRGSGAPPPPPPPNPPPAVNTPPKILGCFPVRNSTTRDKTPLVRCKVTDRETNLRKANIKLYVDGRRITRFSYNVRTDRLSYASKALEVGRHSVKVVVRDAGGRVAVKAWSFGVR